MFLQNNTTDETLILGYDIGGTKTGLVMGNLMGQILRRIEFQTLADQDFDTAIKYICAETDAFLRNCRKDGLPSPHEISVSVGGPMDINRGILYSPPHLASWGTAPLKQRLQEYFHLPVHVEHDGNAGALAEWKFGAGCGLHNLIFLTLGTGLGAGIILNDAILHGASDTAGEVGHMRIAPDGPVQYGKAGSFEGYCGGVGLLLQARAHRPDRWNEATTTRDILALALAGDSDAREVVRQVGTWLGKGLAILVDLLNPQAIIFGTMGIVLGDLLIAPARQAMLEEALPAAAAVCQIVPAGLGNRLQDVSALMAGIMNHSKVNLNDLSNEEMR